MANKNKKAALKTRAHEKLNNKNNHKKRGVFSKVFVPTSFRNGVIKALLLVNAVAITLPSVSIISQVADPNTDLINIRGYVITNLNRSNEMKTYQNIQDRIISMPRMTEALTNSLQTVDEKKEFLDTIVKIIQEETGVLTNKINYFDENDKVFQDKLADGMSPAGYYMLERGIIGGAITFKTIGVKEDILHNGNFPFVVETVIHEMLHAYDHEIISTRLDLSDIDKEVYRTKRYQSGMYYSSFIESNVHLKSNRIIDEAFKYNNITEYRTTTRKDIALFKIISCINRNLPESYKGDDHGTKTLEDIFLDGFKHKLDIENVNYKESELTDTLYFQKFIHNVGQYKNIELTDYLSGSYKISDQNIDNILNDTNPVNETGLATRIKHFEAVLKYNINGVNDEKLLDIRDYILNNINKVPENIKVTYRIENAEQTAKDFGLEINEDILEN